jgi:hypothetical protein
MTVQNVSNHPPVQPLSLDNQRTSPNSFGQASAPRPLPYQSNVPRAACGTPNRVVSEPPRFTPPTDTRPTFSICNGSDVPNNQQSSLLQSGVPPKSSKDSSRTPLALLETQMFCGKPKPRPMVTLLVPISRILPTNATVQPTTKSLHLNQMVQVVSMNALHQILVKKSIFLI